MKIPTDYQVIKHNGSPVAVVVPYDDFLALSSQLDDDDETLPHEVVKALIEGHSTIAAWRRFRGFDQKYMAEKLGISQPAYSQMESRSFFNLRKSNREKLCVILDVRPSQLMDLEAQIE